LKVSRTFTLILVFALSCSNWERIERIVAPRLRAKLLEHLGSNWERIERSAPSVAATSESEARSNWERIESAEPCARASPQPAPPRQFRAATGKELKVSGLADDGTNYYLISKQQLGKN
jgi:hypothetical protein